MFNENGMSPSDISAIVGNNDCGSWVWLIIIILLISLGGGGGFFGARDGFSQYATASSQQEILFGQQFQNIDNKIDRLANGLCDSTYALNNAVQGEGRALQTQLANCCCENQRNTDALRYDMSQMNATTNAVTVAQTQKILDVLSQNKIDDLQAKVNQLETQNMFCGIPRISPYGYGVVPTMPNYFGYGYGTTIS